MKKLVRFVLASAVLVALFMFAASQVAFAGNPHFVDVSATESGNTLTVSGKEAGLGNETQVHIEVTATALCINGGGKHPKAVNKQSVGAAGDFPVQNGKAEFTLTVTATFQPNCSPPMTVDFTDIVVRDSAHNVTARL
jgi:hypothetical protein